MLHPTVSRREWWQVAALAALLMVLTLIPYAVGWRSAPPDTRFTGFLLGIEDGFSYIGKMRLGVQGRWQFHLFYTDEPHDAAPLAFLPYTVPGQLARLWTDADTPGLYGSLVALYHGMRVLFGGLLVLVTYRFIAQFATAQVTRWTALLLAVLGGGLGLLLLPEQTPPEWFIPEGFTFLLLFTLPHLALARAAMLGGFLALFASERRLIYAAGAGALWLLTGLAVPFYLAVIYVILGIWGLLRWIQTRTFPTGLFVRCVIAGGITLPLFGYYAWAFTQNPAFAQWSRQNLLPTPPITHMLLAYGPLVLFAALAVRCAWAQPDKRVTLLLAWALAGLTLVYLPINVQRRLSEGVLVPLAILAAFGIERLIRWLPCCGIMARAALVTVLCSASVGLYGGTLLTVTGRPPAALYTEDDLIGAFHWLNANAVERERGAVVLAPFTVGNRLPAYTNLRPYVGHGPETLFSREKRAQAAAYFRGDMPPVERASLYAAHTINYVVFTGPPPEWAVRELTPVYRQGTVTVFRRR